MIWPLLLGKISCGTQRVIPSGKDSSSLPAWVANHSAGFGSSSPLTELVINKSISNHEQNNTQLLENYSLNFSCHVYFDIKLNSQGEIQYLCAPIIFFFHPYFNLMWPWGSCGMWSSLPYYLEFLLSHWWNLVLWPIPWHISDHWWDHTWHQCLRIQYLITTG